MGDCECSRAIDEAIISKSWNFGYCLDVSRAFGIAGTISGGCLQPSTALLILRIRLEFLLVNSDSASST